MIFLPAQIHNQKPAGVYSWHSVCWFTFPLLLLLVCYFEKNTRPLGDPRVCRRFEDSVDKVANCGASLSRPAFLIKLTVVES